MLEQIKTVLNLKHHEADAVLESLIETTQNRLKILLGGIEAVPEELSYIVIEVVISRFNRIGSEGLSSHSVEGESMAWSQDDFDAYKTDISEWKKQNEKDKGRGVIRFL